MLIENNTSKAEHRGMQQGINCPILDLLSGSSKTDSEDSALTCPPEHQQPSTTPAWTDPRWCRISSSRKPTQHGDTSKKEALDIERETKWLRRQYQAVSSAEDSKLNRGCTAATSGVKQVPSMGYTVRTRTSCNSWRTEGPAGLLLHPGQNRSASGAIEVVATGASDKMAREVVERKVSWAELRKAKTHRIRFSIWVVYDLLQSTSNFAHLGIGHVTSVPSVPEERDSGAYSQLLLESPWGGVLPSAS
ncbi:unnamed protein product [Lota lota]